MQLIDQLQIAILQLAEMKDFAIEAVPILHSERGNCWHSEYFVIQLGLSSGQFYLIGALDPER